MVFQIKLGGVQIIPLFGSKMRKYDRAKNTIATGMYLQIQEPQQCKGSPPAPSIKVTLNSKDVKDRRASERCQVLVQGTQALLVVKESD